MSERLRDLAHIELLSPNPDERPIASETDAPTIPAYATSTGPARTTSPPTQSATTSAAESS